MVLEQGLQLNYFPSLFGGQHTFAFSRCLLCSFILDFYGTPTLLRMEPNGLFCPKSSDNITLLCHNFEQLWAENAAFQSVVSLLTRV